MKFKIGDVVRVITPVEGYQYYTPCEGKISVVVDVAPKAKYPYTLDIYLCYAENELELIRERGDDDDDLYY